MAAQLPMSALTLPQAEQKRDKLATILKWTFVGIAGIIVAPLAFMVLQAVIAAIVSLILAAVAVAAAPWLSFKISNWKLKSVIEEARRNPIPTLEGILIQRRTNLTAAAEQLAEGLGQVSSYITQAEAAAKRYPDMAQSCHVRAAAAKKLGESKERAYMDAKAAVDKFEDTVERCRVEYALVLAENAMNRSMNKLVDPMDALKARVAIDAVTTQMNTAFSRMQVALLTEVTPLAERVQEAPATLSDQRQPGIPFLNTGNDAILVPRYADADPLGAEVQR